MARENISKILKQYSMSDFLLLDLSFYDESLSLFGIPIFL